MVCEVSLGCRGFFYFDAGICLACDCAACPSGFRRDPCVLNKTDGLCVTCTDLIPSFSNFTLGALDCEWECNTGYTRRDTHGESVCINPSDLDEPPSDNNPKFMDAVWVALSVVFTVLALALCFLFAHRFQHIPVLHPSAGAPITKQVGGSRLVADVYRPPNFSPAIPQLGQDQPTVPRQGIEGGGALYGLQTAAAGGKPAQ